MNRQGARTETVGRSYFLRPGARKLVGQLGNCTPAECASHRHPGRGEQLVGARCVPRWRRPARGLGQVRTISAGDGQGGEPPWLRSLPTFCRITESRSPRGSSGGEERVIFSPRGLGLRKQAGCRPAGQLRPVGSLGPTPPRAGGPPLSPSLMRWVSFSRRRRPAFSRPSGCRSAPRTKKYSGHVRDKNFRR